MSTVATTGPIGTPAPPPGDRDRGPGLAPARPGLRWADLLRRVYDIDRRSYPNCGLGTLEPIATILAPDVIARILGSGCEVWRPNPTGDPR